MLVENTLSRRSWAIFRKVRLKKAKCLTKRVVRKTRKMEGYLSLTGMNTIGWDVFILVTYVRSFFSIGKKLMTTLPSMEENVKTLKSKKKYFFFKSGSPGPRHKENNWLDLTNFWLRQPSVSSWCKKLVFNDSFPCLQQSSFLSSPFPSLSPFHASGLVDTKQVHDEIPVNI